MKDYKTVKKLISNDEISFYELSSIENADIFVISTNMTRKILLTPELCGFQFQQNMSDGIHLAFEIIKKMNLIKSLNVSNHLHFDVLYLLRGGLNFNLHQILEDVYHSKCEVSFVSSQRIEEDGLMSIAEDSYTKWSFADDGILCIGDICATGTTMKSVLAKVINHDKSNKIHHKNLVVVTIGTMDSLRNFMSNSNQSLFKYFDKITFIFIEGLFTLHIDNPEINYFHLSNTDFFRKNAIYSIEFELEGLEKPASLLERCVIYDGGSRSFEPNLYLSNLFQYWVNLKSHLNTDNYSELIQTKTNLFDYQKKYAEWLQGVSHWEGIDKERLSRIYEKGRILANSMNYDYVTDLVDSRIHSLKESDA